MPFCTSASCPFIQGPGSLLRMSGAGRTELQPHPEAGRQFLSSARERLVPNQRGVQKGNGIRQKEGDVLVLTEEKLYIYHLENLKPPDPSMSWVSLPPIKK